MKYFMIGGDKREYGPVEAETIREWIREGRANGETLLRAEDESDWKPARAFADFQTELGLNLPASGAAAPVEPANVRINPGHCFARAWHLVGANFGVTVGSCALVLMILTTISISCPKGLGPMVAMLFEGPFYGALFLLFLNLIRTGEGATGQMFALVRDNTASLMLTWLMVGLVASIGLCCCVLPGVFIFVASLLAIPIIADQSAGFWRGLKMSFKIVTPQWFRFFALFMVSFLPVLVFQLYFFSRVSSEMFPHISELFSKTAQPTPADWTRYYEQMNVVGAKYASWFFIKQALLLFTLPFGIASLAFAYEDIFGRKR